MKMLELFSGSGRMSDYFDRLGFETYRVDFNDKLDVNVDLNIDINDLTADYILKHFGRPDVIWASPPCTTFSVASIGYHWKGGNKAYIPKTDRSEKALKLLSHLIKLIQDLNPKVYFIENPRGLMRKMTQMNDLPRYTITYCQYGDNRMKPTDIWTNHPKPLFKPMCKNGSPCHTPAPRGSRTGTQGLKNNYLRSLIPHEFCQYISLISKDFIKDVK